MTHLLAKRMDPGPPRDGRLPGARGQSAGQSIGQPAGEPAGQPGMGAAAKPVVFVLHPSEYLTDYQPNGDGLVANGFLRELLARGYRIHIAVRNIDMQTPLPPNATVYRLGRDAGTPSPGALHVADGIRDRITYMLRARRLLARLRREGRIDLVHQMNPVFTGMSLCMLGCRLPLVLGTYVPRWPREAMQVSNGLKSALADTARKIISFLQQSQASALLITCAASVNRIPLAGWSRHKQVVIPHAVDIQRFAPLADVTPPRDPCILFYSNLWPRKGIFVLLEAFALVRAEMPNCRLSIAGSGPSEEQLRLRIAEAGLGEAITMLGRVAQSRAPELFCKHNVFCLPSYGEPYASAVLEAMSCGRPVVVTNAGGLPDMVPSDGGLLVPVGDAPALAQALLHVLRDPALQASMGRANRRYIEENCSWPRVVDRLEQVYADVTQI